MNRRTLLKFAALFGVGQIANAGRVAMAAAAIPLLPAKAPSFSIVTLLSIRRESRRCSIIFTTISNQWQSGSMVTST